MNVQKPFDTEAVWSAKAKPKVQLFAWTTMHERVLTTDNLESKGWDNNVVCPLCLSEAETNHHFLIECEFAKKVMTIIISWMEYQLHQMPPTTSVSQWLQNITRSLPSSQRKVRMGRILYGW